MTKVFAFFIVTLTLFSCKKVEVIEEPWECLPCGTYFTSFWGDFNTALGQSINIDTVSSTLIIKEIEPYKVDIIIDFENIIAISPNGGFDLVVSDVSVLDTSITGGSTFLYNEIVTLYAEIDAESSFNYQAISGTINLSQDLTGELGFFGIR